MALTNFRGLDFIRVANETLGQLGLPGLFGSTGIEAIRNIDWGKKYLWAVTFLEPKAPAPFASYFPASEIEITDATMDSFNFEAGQGAFKAPQRSVARNVSITFYDDSRFSLQRWMKDWYQIDLFNEGRFVSCLGDDHKSFEDGAPVSGLDTQVALARKIRFEKDDRVWPVRKIQFARLDNSMEPIEGTEQILSIYPEGELQVSGTSGSELNIFTINFAIVGDDTKTLDSKSNNEFLTRAKREATRLLGRFT
jgi:hypothetical protein